MSTKINVTYKGKEYTLEYTKSSAKTIESEGFVLEEIGSKPNVMIPLLVQGAFLKNHRGMPKGLPDEIFAHVTGKAGSEQEQGFVSVLVEMYSEVVNALMADAEESDEGNVATWRVVK